MKRKREEAESKSVHLVFSLGRLYKGKSKQEETIHGSVMD